MQKLTIAALCAASLATAAPAGAASLSSVSRITFGPGDTLFAADWKGASIHAIALPPAAKKAAPPFNILDLEGALAKALGGVRPRVVDMAVRPGTGEAYVAVEYGAARTPAILAVSADGTARRIDLKPLRESVAPIGDAPTAGGTSFWGRIPARSLTVTDMKWHDGELFVAGLSNQTFSSTLRRMHYPFDGRSTTSSIEMYHASHNQIETRAPIRTMAFATLNGQPHLVAAYTCTPLVTIPIADLKDGARVTGKTIAELGYGNTPADMVSFSQTGQDGKVTPYLLLANYERSANMIPLDSIAAAAAQPGLSKPVPFGQMKGPEGQQVPFAGVVRADNLDDKFLLVVRNNVQHGTTQLVTFDKSFQFRLSDFVSEYNFPSYDYSKSEFQTKYIKPVQDTLKKEEGFAGDVKQ
ncbi:hypothetical protein M0208_05025 [Sphingomonas sp. SUN019]|uniref:hypothetical protein n=1 Tax=Sphingomonas sp. SUN019 TaxID=2937788 RepID=UPI00216438E8|nr:hypothetical protein [Sphingomonas sp. SUN019]UVO49910.1 hypothetical protein M0208_05025 [Sphingomonas sp. SUN019]